MKLASIAEAQPALGIAQKSRFLRKKRDFYINIKRKYIVRQLFSGEK